MNSLRLLKYLLIMITFLHISGCYPFIYGVPEEYWITLTDDQKRTAMEGYYEQERLRVLQDNILQIERERKRTEEARWHAEKAEHRAREAEHRAREAEHQLREQQKRDDMKKDSATDKPTKQFGYGRVTK